MKTNLFISILFIISISACVKKENNIRVDRRNFSFVNLNEHFPVIDVSRAFTKTDTLGLTCLECMHDNKKVYLNAVLINGSKRSISLQPFGIGAGYTFTYDSLNRIRSEKIISCFDWYISYTYLDTLDAVYQFSKIEGRETDTTIYKLDAHGRVTDINGIEYGDLLKRSLSKKIYYTGLNSIPDSISIITKSGTNSLERRNEFFYQSNNMLDSIRVVHNTFDQYHSEKQEFINYFKQEVFIGRKIIRSKLDNKEFKVEKFVKDSSYISIGL